MPRVPRNAERCTARTRKGARCTQRRRADLTHPGTTKPLTTCLAHAPKEVRESRGFGGAQPGAGRPRLERPLEAAQRIVEQHAAAMLRPYFKALGLDLEDDGTVTPLPHGAVVIGKDPFGGVHASTIEDLGAQMAAAEKLFDRVFGRPRQATELSGPGGGDIPVSSGGTTVLIPQRPEAVAAILAQAGALTTPEEDPA